MPCLGNSETHCCWLDGKQCVYLEKDTVPGRRWACGLRRKLGDWNLVLDSQEYKTNVAPTFELLGINCRDWPDLPTPVYCDDCGYGN